MKENQIDIITHSIYSSVIRSDKPRQWHGRLTFSDRVLAVTWSELSHHINKSATIDIVIEHCPSHTDVLEAAIIRYTASVPLILRVSTTHVRVIAQGIGTPSAVLH